MIDALTIQNIEQKKFDNIASKHLHVSERKWLNELCTWVDYLAVAVPLLYFPIRMFGRTSQYHGSIEVVWEALAVILIAATLLKVFRKWQEKAQEHSLALGDNIQLVRQADQLLAKAGKASSEKAAYFLDLAARSDIADTKLLGNPKPARKQAAYREALKEYSGVAAACPDCGASPWRFVAGSCQVCGNTPETK